VAVPAPPRRPERLIPYTMVAERPAPHPRRPFRCSTGSSSIQLRNPGLLFAPASVTPGRGQHDGTADRSPPQARGSPAQCDADRPASDASQAPRRHRHASGCEQAPSGSAPPPCDQARRTPQGRCGRAGEGVASASANLGIGAVPAQRWHAGHPRRRRRSRGPRYLHTTMLPAPRLKTIAARCEWAGASCRGNFLIPGAGPLVRGQDPLERPTRDSPGRPTPKRGGNRAIAVRPTSVSCRCPVHRQYRWIIYNYYN
jgi:hypothetical protein